MVSGRWHVDETYIEVLAHRVRSRGNTDAGLDPTGAPALWLSRSDTAGVSTHVTFAPARAAVDHSQAPCGVWPIASIVVIALAPILSTGVWQERAGWPSRCTVIGAAQSLAATKLGPGHAEHVAQHPQERSVAVDIDLMRCAIDL